ncbi:MAG: PEP-CTERM sorting domain-containing protein [Verrucomicrobia bacterium]|nr:PEP-CTERM sorting domain-containing protein [Verrucomicrobiota bacterium]
MAPSRLLASWLLCLAPVFANPVTVKWTDWISGSPSGGTASGVINTGSSTVAVSYLNPQGYAFLQTGTGIDYFQNHLGAAGSPFTSSVVANIPTAAEMIGLHHAGNQTLVFSETIANPFFSYISLNGNGYAFDRDFDILSFGSSTDPEGPNYNGYWGHGTSFKQIVNLPGGGIEYQLLGTGEPHGTIRFRGAFNSVSWRSLSNEYWNGFTVGVEGTAAQVFGTPDGANMTTLLGLAGGFLVLLRRRQAGRR